MELAQDELHVEEREGAEGEHEDVGDEEGSAAVLVRRVREPPHVAKTHLACASNIWKRISDLFQRKFCHS